MSANWAETPETQLWEQASDSSNPDRRKALENLFEYLTAADRLDEASQTGYVWFDSFEDSLESEDFYDCAFKLSCVLTNNGELDESRKLIDDVLNRPYIDDANRERGFLYWQQSANFVKLDDWNARVRALENALECFHDFEPLLGFVHFDMAIALDGKAHESSRLVHLTKAIDFLQGNDADVRVAEAKEMAAETLMSQGHSKTAWNYASDAGHLYAFLDVGEGVQRCELLKARIASALGLDMQAMKLFGEAVKGRSSHAEKQTAAKAVFYRAEHLLSAGKKDAARHLFASIEPVLRALGNETLADDAFDRLRLLS